VGAAKKRAFCAPERMTDFICEICLALCLVKLEAFDSISSLRILYFKLMIYINLMFSLKI